MKKAKTLFSLLLSAILATTAMVFASCVNNDSTSDSADDPAKSDSVLEFVAADKTNWDKEVTLSQKTYQLSLKLNKNNTLALTGTCTGKAASSGGGGGWGGFGAPVSAISRGAELHGVGPGGDDGGNDSAFDSEEEITDFTPYNFTIDGTWTEESGWGYTLKLSDGNDTEIVVDYDTTMGRHLFYYYMAPTINGEKASETQIQFQAKDSAYRKTLNKDYVIHAERTKTYMFHGGGFDGMTGNKAEVRLYLLNNGGIACYSESGSELTYTGKGSWSEDKTNHVMNVEVGNTKMTSNAYCDAAGREGYRMNYSTGRTSIETFCPVASGMTWDKYTDSDFDGAEICTLDGGDYTLMLTTKNFAILKKGTSKISTYTFELDAENNYVIKDGKVTVIKEDFFNPEIETSDTVSVKDGEEISITVSVGVQNGPSKKYTDVVFKGKVS